MIQQNIGIIPWRDEMGMDNYPLDTPPLDDTNVFVDGVFIQFDGFIPVLDTVQFTDDSCIFTITTYKGKVIGSIDYPINTDVVLFIDNDGVMHGKLIIGSGFSAFRERYASQTVTLACSILPAAVRHVASAAGVYSIDNHTDVTTFTGGADKHIHFEPTGNGVFVDAVYVPSCTAEHPLLTLNGASGNSLKLVVPDVLMLTPISGGIRIDLATKNALKIAQ